MSGSHWPNRVHRASRSFDRIKSDMGPVPGRIHSNRRSSSVVITMVQTLVNSKKKNKKKTNWINTKKKRKWNVFSMGTKSELNFPPNDWICNGCNGNFISFSLINHSCRKFLDPRGNRNPGTSDPIHHEREEFIGFQLRQASKCSLIWILSLPETRS